MTRPLDIQGHRGARALFPENTLEGFLATSALGINAFELDVGMTADGFVVVSHDPALNPDITRDIAGFWLRQRGPTIRSLTLAALRGYDVGRIQPGSRTASVFPNQVPHDGSRIPPLAAVLAALPNTRFTIEVKTNPAHPDWTASPRQIAEATMSVVDEARAASRVTIESFDWRVQRHLRATRPDVLLAWLTSAETAAESALWWDGVPSGRSIPAQVAAEGGPIWTPKFVSLTKAQIQQAHALSLSVLPWTVNRLEDMRRLIVWGVDGLISDRPDLAHQALIDSDMDASSTNARDPGQGQAPR